jgi:hypothetical protein
VALDWLNEQPEHVSWSSVWELLWKQEQSNAELRLSGLDWLRTTPNDDERWGSMWVLLRNEASCDDQLQRSGLDWLKNGPFEHKRWAQVWASLWAIGLENVELWQIGMNWLRLAPSTQRGWSQVWRTLWETDPGNVELKHVGYCYLDDFTAKNYYWPVVWIRLWSHFDKTEDLTVLAIDWLQRSERPRSWAHVWIAVAESGLADPWLLCHIARKLLAYVRPKQFRDIETWIEKYDAEIYP